MINSKVLECVRISKSISSIEQLKPLENILKERKKIAEAFIRESNKEIMTEYWFLIQDYNDRIMKFIGLPSDGGE